MQDVLVSVSVVAGVIYTLTKAREVYWETEQIKREIEKDE